MRTIPTTRAVWMLLAALLLALPAPLWAAVGGGGCCAPEPGCCAGDEGTARVETVQEEACGCGCLVRAPDPAGPLPASAPSSPLPGADLTPGDDGPAPAPSSTGCDEAPRRGPVAQAGTSARLRFCVRLL